MLTTKYQSDDGKFVRPDSTFRHFISEDPNSKYPAEKGRYALYLSPLCPWAHRTLIVRALKGLEDIIDVYQVTMDTSGWVFNGESGSLPSDPLHSFKSLKELYTHVNPTFTGRVTVPVLWDKKTDTLVNNESSDIIRMFASAFDSLIPEELREENRPGGGLYPAPLRAQIDELNDWVYATVNNGVYKAGFATAQEAYEEAVEGVFASLDRLEGILEGHGKPFLFGDTLTLADVRLYTTVARFDVGYVPVFQCNLKTIRHDYPHLHAWLRRLYWDDESVKEQTRGAFGGTTREHIGGYGKGYAAARHSIVMQGAGSLILPAGPLVPIEPL